jgi:hypothetical protein
MIRDQDELSHLVSRSDKVSKPLFALLLTRESTANFSYVACELPIIGSIVGTARAILCGLRDFVRSYWCFS